MIADGPKDHIDAIKCEEVRKSILEIKWPCELVTNFADSNYGCKQRVITGLDWAFEQVDEAIILEDDCIPHPSFFPFCAEMLQTYRDDRRVMMISGTNIKEKWAEDNFSYFFSSYGSVWGWATWKRAWKLYDRNFQLWQSPEVKNRVKDLINNEPLFQDRLNRLDETYAGRIDTWDHQWVLTCMVNAGLCVIPTVNLIANLGFRDDATHTLYSNNPCADLPTFEMKFPLVEPPTFLCDRKYDQMYMFEISGRSQKRPQRGFRRRYVSMLEKLISVLENSRISQYS
ncbi:MAG: glycosyltransferase family 2 protein [Cyanobacteria bacterium P01_H01_bin.15]